MNGRVTGRELKLKTELETIIITKYNCKCLINAPEILSISVHMI
jgi:hypothetical protein